METTKIELMNNSDYHQEKEQQEQSLIPDQQMIEHHDDDEEEKIKKKSIFVAVDESDDSFYVLRWVLDNLIKHLSSSSSVDETEIIIHDHLTLFHVIPRPPQYVFPGAPVVMPAISINTNVQKEQAAELLTRAMHICKEEKVEAEIVVREGDPKETICQATEDLNVDLLVVGSRGRGKIKRALLGSVSDYCAHHAKCPVVIVKPPKEPKESHN
ncbi:hypothetical protein Leryth_008814 [Lithospermum erythrorhizon]|nr:hypothetical protein Leryth_008814 [Lithospermum erythrorhizon]